MQITTIFSPTIIPFSRVCIQVAGTLAASGLNNFGIAGMIPDEHVCLVICRIFGDYGGVREKMSSS